MTGRPRLLETHGCQGGAHAGYVRAGWDVTYRLLSARDGDPLPVNRAALEAELANRDDIPEHRKAWGWGADPGAKAAEKAYQAQFAGGSDESDDGDLPNLCSSCDDRFQAAFDFGGVA